jgi:predicted alpha/beta-hydrolase family hydrolase
VPLAEDSVPGRAEHASFVWSGGTVSGLWDHPATRETYLVLGHGAGGNLNTPGLANVAAALAAGGIGAVRFNFPYAEARRRVPDPQRTLEACYQAVAEHVAGQIRGRASRLLLGGRSMGGRIASHVVANGFPAHGLVFLSYPLHPPGKPERLRDAHLGEIRSPMLFVQGSRDPFATPDLLRATVRRLESATLHVLENGDHGLKVRGRTDVDVTGEIVGVIGAWLRGLAAHPLP